MRIFFPIGAFFPSQIGGPCNTLYWHTSELNKFDFNIDIVTTSIGIDKGIVKENVFFRNECGNIYYGKGGSAKVKTILTAIGKIKSSDIIHLNSLFNILSIIVFFYAKIFFHKKKIIWSVRGELNKNALKYSSWKKKPILSLYKRLCKNVIFHSTSSQETKDINLRFNESIIIQIPNLIRPKERIHLKDIQKQLLYVGRIHPIKAIHKIIEGLSLSKSFLNSEFTFVLVGKCEDRHKYYFKELCDLINKKGLKEKVEFKGHLIGSDKELIYAQSFATLLLSETENFGNVVVESLNQGTPVITSKGTPWSIVEQYKCGYHIDNEPYIIGKTVDRIINMNNEDYKLSRKNAIKLVEDEFNIENQIHRWIIQYKK